MNKKYDDIPRCLVNAIGKRWDLGLLAGSGWTDRESWIRWAYENGYKKGYHLGKFDDRKPHGPENSFFYESEAKMESDRKAKARNLCSECTLPCPAEGCAQWREWFVKNWDKNIYRKPNNALKEETERKVRFFQYEHPDLVREGIV